MDSMSNTPSNSSKAPKNPDDLKKHIHEKNIEEHLDQITREFRRGFEFVQKYPRSVTVFGSSMASQDNLWCVHATELAGRIAKELGYAVIDGGGPGIMEAASKGAREAGGTSVGLRINLLREQLPNAYTGEGLDFTYFFTRKTMLAFAAETYVFFPGGYGTFDELFGILTLIQTSKIPRVPIILFESGFWNPFKEFLVKDMLGATHTIDHQDLDLFEITDSQDRAIEIIKKAPVSEWWRNID
jgi:hypothetical protein